MTTSLKDNTIQEFLISAALLVVSNLYEHDISAIALFFANLANIPDFLRRRRYFYYILVFF